VRGNIQGGVGQCLSGWRRAGACTRLRPRPRQPAARARDGACMPAQRRLRRPWGPTPRRAAGGRRLFLKAVWGRLMETSSSARAPARTRTSYWMRPVPRGPACATLPLSTLPCRHGRVASRPHVLLLPLPLPAPSPATRTGVRDAAAAVRRPGGSSHEAC
jgi:hypothetical protein